MRIGQLDTAEQVLVIAEIGNNHEGDPETAAALVRAAAAAGADAVKLQIFRTELFVRRTDAERYERMSRFELPVSNVARLAELAQSLGLLFVCTPLDLETAAALEPLVDAYKIASGDNDFVALLDRVAGTGLPVIVSSGLSELETIAAAVARVRQAWSDSNAGGELAVLQCTGSYPAPAAEANLAAIPFLAEQLGCTVGYSDHTLGLDAAVAAVAAGARIVEKHFTLDKGKSGFRDHALSADPADLRELVARTRAIEELLGRPEKRLQPSERDTAHAARRSIVAASELTAGHRLTLDDLTWLRPGDGLPPGSESQLVGRALARDVGAGEPILAVDVH